jgi:hypothetical protein
LPEEIDHLRQRQDAVRVGGVDVKVTEQHTDAPIIGGRREAPARPEKKYAERGVRTV